MINERLRRPGDRKAYILIEGDGQTVTLYDMQRTVIECFSPEPFVDLDAAWRLFVVGVVFNHGVAIPEDYTPDAVLDARSLLRGMPADLHCTPVHPQ